MKNPRHVVEAGGQQDKSNSEIINDDPRSSYDETISFLNRLHPDREKTLVVFKPQPDGYTFQATEVQDIQRCVRFRDGKSDLYVLIGIADGRPNGQPKKEMMVGSGCLWIDRDPDPEEDLESERKRIFESLTDKLPESVPPPTIIVDSGRGYWALWLLVKPCLDVDRIEACNLWLANKFGADKCHNINRVMRLPGTINLKTNQRAKVVSDEVNCIYSIEDFGESSLPTESVIPSDKAISPILTAQRVVEPSELEQWGSGPEIDRLKVLMVQGRDPDKPKKNDDSRSAWVFDFSCNAIRAGIPNEVILGILTDPAWSISDHVLAQKVSPQKYAIRQIEQAHNAVESESSEFQVDGNNVPYKNQHNIRIALLKLGVQLSHDTFADRLMLNNKVLQDKHVASLYLQIDEQFGFRPGKDFFWMVVEHEARKQPYHPVHDYIDELVWDGASRIDTWLIKYGGAEDTLYTRAVGTLALLAAVRRIRKPGCKFDEMLVLRSPQGSLKSTALQALCPVSDWFTDDLPLSADTKVVIERLEGRWIVEAAELKGMRRGEVEHIKSFLSRQVDRARMAYGRIPREVQRQCIIIGTTNSDRFLKDMTGNRRFWPVKVERFDTAALKRDRDQLWAETAYREAAGESIRLDPMLYDAATDAQEEHRVEDPFVIELQRVLGDIVGKISAADVWDIVGVLPGQRTQDHNQRLGEAMRELGWRRIKLRIDGSPQYCYVRGEGSGRKGNIYERIHLERDVENRWRVRLKNQREIF